MLFIPLLSHRYRFEKDVPDAPELTLPEIKCLVVWIFLTNGDQSSGLDVHLGLPMAIDAQCLHPDGFEIMDEVILLVPDDNRLYVAASLDFSLHLLKDV